MKVGQCAWSADALETSSINSADDEGALEPDEDLDAEVHTDSEDRGVDIRSTSASGQGRASSDVHRCDIVSSGCEVEACCLD